MKTIKAVIIDDESSARDIIEGLLKNYFPNVEVLAKCEDLEQGIIAIRKEQPDVVFLDIEMPNYAGYEIVNYFDKIEFEIIFVTAYDQYAVKAFELSAVDYLLKPIDIDRFRKSVKRLQEKVKLKHIKSNYQVLKDNLSKESHKKIIIPNHGDQKVIPLNNIIAFEAKEAYTTIHTIDEGRFMMSKNLKHFENLLEGESQFYRSHKSWIIQIPLIKKYSKSELTVLLENDLTAKLSKYKKSDFEEKFKF
ncbi:LytR/AlgR family response regulator transcription factor [Crocinitomix algicola]|uniref:LytR/AlgR family response regulator transcription factor n=1 Tax=Crocinitomix algicola TaxID=1740263 RepID=UPI001586404A|nr:LytTR family DNA-binding domain-containing protein [Crocinitomix algicola]